MTDAVLSGSCFWHLLASPTLRSPTDQLSRHSTEKTQTAGKWSEHVPVPQSTDPQTSPSPFSFLLPYLSHIGKDTALTPPVGHTRACVRTSCLPVPPSSSHWGWEPVGQPGGKQVFMLGGEGQSKGTALR
ncbi:hypothetical protein mRhiFer1_009398 [Rhinolophus ferrumequinum]|uniref:Uncharacterized protein n=1 Tax=Rhinolophus ferrumequinum TaxID=59479 RepID=A0A7J7RQD6_RHIFE|nr:hypothetical protein mRhiFer1_009398 [Rhinolophus ferrumequinum]